jgi:acetoin:2,6-dichlorophenolindophenol oxidoreductase subunit alpha
MQLLALFRGMLRVRKAELALQELFAAGEVPGFIHLSIGQEASAVGVVSALTREDTLASTHRGHGHALAKGVDLTRFFLEVLGKDEGLCRGRGGSMHVADLSAGMLGANGIVAAGVPIAVGSALAHQVQQNGRVAVAFFGDGALAEGVLHESFNLAALWCLPVLFVCENNGWSEFSPTAAQFRGTLAQLAASFGMPFRKLDGADVLDVHETALELVAKARAGAPQVLECTTQRHRGHYEGDAQRYRDPDELERARAEDPLLRAEARLGASHAPQLTALTREVEAEVQQAVAQAQKGSEPSFAAALRDVCAGARHD